MGRDELFLDVGRDFPLVALGEDRLGRQAVRANAVRAGLSGKILGEQLNAGLRGGLGHW